MTPSTWFGACEHLLQVTFVGNQLLLVSHQRIDELCGVLENGGLAEFFAHLWADDTSKRLEASVDALHPLSLVAVGDLSPIPTIGVIVSAMPLVVS